MDLNVTDSPGNEMQQPAQKRPPLSLGARLARVVILTRKLARAQRQLEQHLHELGVSEDEIERMDVRLRVGDVPSGNTAIYRQILRNTFPDPPGVRR